LAPVAIDFCFGSDPEVRHVLRNGGRRPVSGHCWAKSNLVTSTVPAPSLCRIRPGAGDAQLIARSDLRWRRDLLLDHQLLDRHHRLDRAERHQLAAAQRMVGRRAPAARLDLGFAQLLELLDRSVVLRVRRARRVPGGAFMAFLPGCPAAMFAAEGDAAETAGKRAALTAGLRLTAAVSAPSRDGSS
jgi:hypothetical protein